MRISRTSLAAIGLVASLAAQGTNATLLGTYSNHGPTFNDCWGYVAPNGDEYALLLSNTGTVVIDVTNPSTPVETGWLPWGSSTWRDARTYSHYAYVVTEATAGFQIIDLQNPNAPVDLGAFGTSHSSHAHNICIDTGAGRLYLVGTNAGTQVFDLTTNPANPTYVGQAYPAGGSNYYHDLCVENGFGYGAMIYTGKLRIFDVTSWPPATLSDTPTPGNFTHNAWPNAAGTLCVTTDEVNGGVIKLFDITNKSAPVPLGQFTPNASTIPHNAYIVGNYVHVSWYSMGYRCIDISDPNNPVEVASYDTYPGTTTGYDGCWGVYPFFPSGNILASDRQSGLFIIKPNLTDLSITHTPLQTTNNEIGPYGVLCDVTSSNPIGSVTLYWRQGNSGTFTSVPMTQIPSTTQYTGSIPGHDAVTEIQYYIEAIDSVGTAQSPPSGTHSFEIGTFQVLYSDDFESNTGWSHATTAVQDDWQRGSPAGMSGVSGGIAWQDPSTAWSGNSIWANDLGGVINGQNWNGSYQNNNSNWLQSPAIPTQGLQGLHLRFRRWLQLAPGDTGTVLVNGNVVYQNSAGINDGQWELADIDISSISNGASTLTVRFELLTNSSVVSGGWAIDDVEIVRISDSAPPTIYGSGTPGTGGQTPAISLGGTACVGTTPQIYGTNMLSNGAAFLALNFADANVANSGITVLVEPTGVATIFGQADASGLAAWPFAVPNDPSLDNLYIYAQVIPLDPGGPAGLVSASPGLRFRICLN